MTSMYRENVMDHYRNPRNKGVMDGGDVNFRDTNPSCGDEVEWHVKVKDGRIREISFEGDGCAISQASTSMVSEEVLGKELEEVKDMENDDVFDMLGVEVSPMRIKCALLGLKALKKAILMYEAGDGNE